MKAASLRQLNPYRFSTRTRAMTKKMSHLEGQRRGAIRFDTIIPTILALILLCASRQTLRADGLSPPGWHPCQYDSWSFEDTNNWTSDLGYAPVAFTNISASLLGNSLSIVVD